jgi:hypothetical protein
MDWSKVISSAEKVAPLLATGLGGPLAGGIVATLESVFGLSPGTATPDTLANAIAIDPNAALKLKQAELDFKIQSLQEDTKQLIAVNETMQAESKSEHWTQYTRRPVWGFLSAGAFFIVCSAVCYLVYQAIENKDGTAMGNIPLIIGSFTTLFSVPGAILGIASWKRGDMQIANAKGNGVS